LEVVKQLISETPNQQKNAGMPIHMSEKIQPQVKQKSTESLDWNPVTPKIGHRLIIRLTGKSIKGYIPPEAFGVILVSASFPGERDKIIH
jgi:hypothetical protein